MSRQIDRRTFLGLLGKGLAALSFPLLGCAGQIQEREPNIIIFMADDMGYGDISCYDGWIKTPNLERLAAEGMLFTDYHAGAPVCTPTRAALLTGRYQQRAGLPGVIYASRQRNRHQGLQLKEITFAEVARDVGYATAVFGKWHLGYQEQFNPTHQGFDEFRGYVSGNIDYFSHIDGIGVYDWWADSEKVREEGYSTHLINHHAVQFIEAHRDQPFCLYVAHEAPHYPYQGPHDDPIREEGRQIREDRNPEQVHRAYREMVEEEDRGMGQILETLDRLGLSQNTFLFFCSDNGALPYGSNGKLRGWKGSVWEGGHRVPAIARWPGHVKPGSTTDALTICLDVMPTILELTGGTLPKSHQLDGKSLLPVVLQNASRDDRWLFWGYDGQQGVRHGHWKLVRNVKDQVGAHPRLGVGLYNLADDIGEQQNLVEQYPDRAGQMLQALGDWEKDVLGNATLQSINNGTE